MSGRRLRVWAPVLLLSLVSGCASTVPLTVFQPRDVGSVQSFFRNGEAIGAIYGDSVFALVQVVPLEIRDQGRPGSISSPDGWDYARLWLLVENHSSRPMLIEPLKCAVLRVETTETVDRHGQAIKEDEFKDRKPSTWQPLSLTPTSPTKILASISNAKASSSILSGIGAALEAAAAQPTTVTTTHDLDIRKTTTTTVNDKGEKQQAILDRSNARRSAADDWYESFKSSVSQGILRRNTLFPGEGVNGYIYFRVADVQPDSKLRRYVVTLNLPGGEKVATFDPIEGE